MSLYLSWDNSGVLANPNAIGQRALQRVKAVGGAYSSLGFTPANDLATSVNTVEFGLPHIVVNRVFEFKVATLCTTGGPTDSSVFEQIEFSCIDPEITSDEDSVSIVIDLSTTDITQARLTLKKQSDNSVVGGPTIVANIGDEINHTFTGLDANTGYYLEVEYYADVNGDEIISSDAEYMNSPCGGNVSGYQIDTTAEANIALINEIVTGGNTIDSLAGSWHDFAGGDFPIAPDSTELGFHTGFSGSVVVGATVTVDSRVEIYINAALTYCFGQVGTGSQVYTLTGVVIVPSDTVEIRLMSGDVCS